VLETNIDDVTGEILGYVIGSALATGALDAWATPAVIKKGRPAYVLHVLSRPADAARLRRLIVAETGTLGVRTVIVERTAEERRFTEVSLRGHPVRLKHGPFGAKPEHDDLVAAARALGIPLRQAAAEALRLAEVTDDH
jgi:pyridinium-3,5-bisthiocarboxylic acid mononucleotide nickel chelatase